RLEGERVVAGLDRRQQAAPCVYGEGLAVDGLRGALRLTREIVEGEVGVVELRQAVDRGDESVAHADLDLHRNAFADIDFVLGHFQVHEGRAVRGQVNAAGVGAAGEEGGRAGRGAIAKSRATAAASWIDSKHQRRRCRRQARDGEYT